MSSLQQSYLGHESWLGNARLEQIAGWVVTFLPGLFSRGSWRRRWPGRNKLMLTNAFRVAILYIDVRFLVWRLGPNQDNAVIQ